MGPAAAAGKTSSSCLLAVLGCFATLTSASASTQYWLACGRTTFCQDSNACCAIWGLCGYGDRFCGSNCLNGACQGGSKGSPPPPASSNSSTPRRDLPPNFDPMRFVDALASAQEGQVALAGCDSAGWLISRVENALYGNVAARCNSTLSYLVTSAACVGQSACIVPAANAVFDDPCPGIRKALQFGYRCQLLLGAKANSSSIAAPAPSAGFPFSSSRSPPAGPK